MNKYTDGRIILGIPCKYSDIAIIPKHIYEYFEGGEIIAKCRGGELATLEVIEEYTSNDVINADLSAMFGMGIVEYASLWKKRVDAVKLREKGWIKVRMNKID